MNRFERVKQILDAAVGGQNFAAHGAFWRGKSRDQLVAEVVFGQTLLVVGDGAGSNLVKALRGQAPFGQDQGTPGAFFRRMPAGRPAVAAADVDFIEQWIDDGCPAQDEEGPLSVDAEAGGPVDAGEHVDFWREFDDRAMFQATPETVAAINTIFGIFPLWAALATNAALLADWELAIAQPGPDHALRLLSELHADTVRAHYGNPVPLLTLLDGFERFGTDSLPDDPLRPEDPRHNMNGSVMWFIWSAFADACLRRSIEPELWHGLARALLLGLLNDGVFRQRYPVLGFTADDAGREAMRQHVLQLADADLPGELARRFVDSGLGN